MAKQEKAGIKEMKVFQIGLDEVLEMEKDGQDRLYEKFKEKFKQKKTTDDCYTPQNIYEAVAEWVQKEYGRDKKGFVRPFWPGADYKEIEYKDDCTVVDNPPFSILSEIIRFYCEKGVRFFLFAPALTLFSTRNIDVSYLAAGCPITYENGAVVNTSFITNLDDCRARTCPELYKAVKTENDKNIHETKKELPRYEYPDEIVTAAMVQRWTHYGIKWRLEKDSCVKVSALDEQKKAGKGIFGSGFLLSERAAAERAAAERAAAERAAAERAAAERAAAERAAGNKWNLSDREKGIVSTLK